jgi:hypothetical protein
MTGFIKPGLNFLEIRHDLDCPMLSGGSHCVCEAVEMVTHQDESRFVKTVVQNRAERRKAAREAEKALRRARRGRA